MKTKSPVVASLLVLLLCLTPFFLGCGSKAAPGTISIVASSSSIAAGMTAQLRAIDSVDSQGTDVTTSVTWSSSNSKVATVSATGMLTAVTPGSATVSAVLNNANGALSVSVTTATVSSVAIAPQNYTLVTGATEQYTLTATNSDSSTTDVSASTAWSVTPASVATISNTGVLTAVGPGSYGVSATYGTFTASAIGVVTASSLTSITVTPATATLSAGATQQFIATGAFADGSTGDLTKTVTWTSSNASVLTINVNGLATAARTNNPATNVNIIAEFNNLSATAAVTVNPAASITSLTVAPTSSSIANGSAEQSTATANYSDGTQQDVTSQVTWSVVANTPTSVAKGAKAGGRLAHATSSGVVNVNQSGIDSATTPGIATLQASLGGAQSQSTVIVTSATITALAVKSTSNEFPTGSAQPVQLIGTFSDGSTQDLSLTANWQSSNPAVATISSSSGLAMGVGPGSVVFSGSFGGLQASSVKMTVLPQTLLSTAINVQYPLLPQQASEPLSLVGNYTNGTIQNLTPIATWTSSNPSVLTVDSSGKAYAVSAGTAQVIGTALSQSTITTITVNASQPTALEIVPTNPRIASATHRRFRALANFGPNLQADFSPAVVWTSSDPSILTVDGDGNVKGGNVGVATITAVLAGVSATSTPITVTNPTLVRLNITPASAQIAPGTSEDFDVTAIFSDGSQQDVSNDADWTTSNSIVAGIDATGNTDGVTAGTVAVSATFWSQTVSSTLTVSNAVLTSVSVSPSNLTVPVGVNRQFQLLGNFSDGTTQDLSAYAEWFATQPLIVVEFLNGQVSGLSVGTAEVGAQYGNFSAATPVTVDNSTLSSMSTTPTSVTLRQGQSQQLNPVVTFSDGYSQSLIGSAVFTPGNRLIADIGRPGIIFAAGVGSTSIVTTYRDQSNTTQVQVLSNVLSSLSISPSSPALNSGNQQQLTATGTYTDGTTDNVSSSLVWTSSNPNVLNVDENGLLTSFPVTTATSVTITGQSGTATQTITVIVYPAGANIPTSPLTALYVLPTSDRLETGTAVQLSAIGFYADGSSGNLTNAVAWSSANPGLVTVSGSGLATGVTPGIATLQAQLGSIQSQTSIVVGTGTLTTATISPNAINLAQGNAQQLTLTGTFSDKIQQNLNPVATWTSATPAVATVSTSGVVTAVAPGTAQISGTALGQTGTTTMVVNSATLTSLQLIPSTLSFAVGTTQQFLVLGYYSDGSVGSVTSATTFSSSDASVVTITSYGLATGLIPGSAQIGATVGGQTTTTQSVTVTPATLVSIAVSPTHVTFAAGTTEQFTATGTFSDGTTQDLSSEVIWTSSNPQALTIDQFGYATGGGSGLVQITAAFEGLSATTGTVWVTSATLQNLTISPTSASIAKTTVQQFTATGTFSDGTTQNLSNVVNWSSSNGTVVSITATGLAVGNSPGSAQLTASYRGLSASTASFQVTSATLTSLSFSPASPSIAPGTQAQVTVTGTFSDGTTQNLTYGAIYSSSNTAVVTVSNGLLTAVGTGTAIITVYAGNQTSTFTVTVTGATLASIAITPTSPAAMAKGTTQQFTATGTYSDGSTQNLTTVVTWSSSNSSIIAISNNGLATAAGIGSATITATYQGQTATTPTVQVTAAAIASIAVTPANMTINTAGTQQYAATATYTDDTTQNVTSSVTWSSSTTAVATITSTGLAAGITAGATTIGAALNSVSGSTTLTVTTPSGPNPTLSSVVVVPTSSRAAAGTSVEFYALGVFSNGSVQNISSTVTWSSSNSAIATVNTSGVATGIVPGTATIQATSGSLESSATLVVSSAILTSVAISPSGSSFAVGAAQQLTVTGTFSDGTTQNLNASATWASLANTVATVSTSGVVTGVSSGTAQITATVDGNTASTTVTITQATLVSISVFPNRFNFANGTTQQFIIIGLYSDGSSHDVTGSATFVSSNPSVISVSTSGLVTAVSIGSTTITITFDGQTVTTQTITVTPATLVSIAISPNTATFANGTTQQFTATGAFSDGTTQNLTNQVIWSSSNPQILTINQYGYAEGGGAGSVQISASWNGISSTTGTMQVTSATLTSLSISPTSATIAKDTSEQFTATGTFSDGSTQNLSNEVNWSSSNGAVVSINAAGFATGTSAGSAQLTAAFRNLSASTTSFVVSSATLVSLSFNPPSPSVAVGSNTQVTVTGTFSDSTTQNLTDNAYFSSSNLSVATVSSGGVVTGVAAGTSTISVQVDGETSSFTITVTGATLTSIAITPTNPPSFAKGTTEQFTATGTYSDGSTQNLTTVVTWASSNTSVMTINSSGLATGTGAGSATITAAYQSKTATTPTVQVTAATVASIAVTPANQSISTSSSQQYTATATYTDATTQNVTSTVTWSSSSTSVATITSGGLAAGVAPGNTTIGAQLNSVSGSTTLTVTTPSTPTLTSITITPSSATIPSGTTQQFMATGNYSNGTTQNLTALASWQSSNTSVATVSSTGLATAVAAGSTQIYAFYQGQSANVVLTVSSATLSSLSVTPTTATIASGTTQQFTATGTLSDGSTQNLTNSVTWSSSLQSVATINASGLATGEATGATVITATVGSTNATATLTVSAATVISLQLSPASATLPTGSTQQLTATANFSNTTSQNVTSSCTYTTSNAAVATVNSSGLVQGVSAGSATITATLGGSTATSTITVTSAALSSLAITPANPSLAAGTSQQLTATGTFTDGSTQNLTNSVTWSSSSTSTASVSAAGNLVAAHTGTTTITAAAGSVTTTTTATVTSAVVTTITISPSSATLAAGQTQQFTATATLSDGTQQAATSSAHWSVSDPTKASISNTSGSNGSLTTTAAGSISVTATLNSVSGSASVTITSATLSSINVSPTPVTMVAGTTVALTVTGSYSDNSSANLTTSATYSTSSSSVATVDSNGVLHGIALGVATITVAVGSTTTTDVVTVDTATLNSITITPAAPTVPIGLTTQLTATGNYSDGSTANISSQVQWTSSTPATATVSTTGLITAKASGTTNVTATMNSVTGTNAVTVTSAVLQSIAVQTTETSFPLGLSVQLTAIGTYSDSSTQNLTSSVTWSSQTPSIGVVNPSGLATGVTTGAFNAAATLNGVTGTLQLNVTSAVLQSITVTPANQIIVNLPGDTLQFTATGSYSDGTTQNLTDSVHWSIGGVDVGTISSTGSFSAVAIGLGTVTATSGTISGSTGLTVISL